MDSDPTRPPVLDAGTLPVGGRIRERPEDFAVDEIPLYPPCGEGEHLFLHVEKTGITTSHLVQRVASTLRIPERDIGFAGQKDRHGVTRQWISVPAAAASRARALDFPGATVLESIHHRNKLKLGHLRGNRFRIRIRGGTPSMASGIRALLERFAVEGMPNGYGAQRFGTFRRNHLFGGAIVRGDGAAFLALAAEPVDGEHPRVVEGRRLLAEHLHREALAAFPGAHRVERHLAQVLRRGGDASAALRTLPRRDRDFLVAAWQSAAFNAVLARRLEDGRPLLEGDVAMKLPQGACFLVTDREAEADRLSRLEIVPTGPLPGARTLEPAGEALRIEADALRPFALDPRGGGALSPRRFRGARRPLRVPLGDPTVEEGEEPGDYVLGFTLPAGSFATALLAWLRCDASGGPGGDDA